MMMKLFTLTNNCICARTTVRRLSVYTTARLRFYIAVALLSTLCWLSYNVIFVIHHHRNANHQNKSKKSLGFLAPPPDIDNSPSNGYSGIKRKNVGSISFGSGNRRGGQNGQNDNNFPGEFIPPTAHYQQKRRYNNKLRKLRPINTLDIDGLLNGQSLTDGIELFPPDKLITGMGDGGEPAQLPATLRSKSLKYFDENSFDVVLSDHMSLNRKLKDYRGEM